jgi:hypothetical protein
MDRSLTHCSLRVGLVQWQQPWLTTNRLVALQLHLPLDLLLGTVCNHPLRSSLLLIIRYSEIGVRRANPTTRPSRVHLVHKGQMKERDASTAPFAGCM